MDLITSIAVGLTSLEVSFSFMLLALIVMAVGTVLRHNEEETAGTVTLVLGILLLLFGFVVSTFVAECSGDLLHYYNPYCYPSMI